MGKSIMDNVLSTGGRVTRAGDLAVVYLQGCAFADLAVGKTPIGLPKLIAEASTQAGTFMADTRRREDARISASAQVAEGQEAGKE